MADRLCRRGVPPKTGIVHFGPGAFFRAHLAAYTDEAMALGGGDWGILAVSLKSPRAVEQLEPQGGVYTTVELGPEGRTTRRIGSVCQCFEARADPARVIAAIADPATRIVSLTITEKGYGYDPESGSLDKRHVDIAHDLMMSEPPRSAMGYLLAGLQARRATGAGALTVLSCDNLPANGQVTRAVLRAFARETAPAMGSWIDDHIRFPSCMVDRITPATTPEDLDRLEVEAGYRDEAAVMHEPFRQWVIEDDFAAGRPAWELAGAEMVADVADHERMKLRCLNGTHSALAYLGALAGHQSVADATADPVFAGFCRKLWSQDIVPTVPAPEGTDLGQYTEALLARYRNPAIQHRTHQIAMDGSQKLPQRIIATLMDHLAKGRVAGGLCLVIAGWMRYVGGVDDAGRNFDISDPLASELRAAHGAAETPDGRVSAFLALGSIFPSDLARDPRVIAEVTAAYGAIENLGARGAVQAWLA